MSVSEMSVSESNISQNEIPTVLTIAGSDSSGGAGIQADMAAIRALGAYPLTAISCITSQNSRGFRMMQPVDTAIFKDQLLACFEDFTPDAVKIGMIPSREHFKIIRDILSKFKPANVVIDPIQAPSVVSGNYQGFNWDIRSLKSIAKFTTLLTPNIPEILTLLGKDSDKRFNSNNLSDDDCYDLAFELSQVSGINNILLKGGHRSATESSDYGFYKDDDGFLFRFKFSNTRIETRNAHGTGCVLSSSVAALLAKGEELPEAVEYAKDFLHEALDINKDIIWTDFPDSHGPALIRIPKLIIN